LRGDAPATGSLQLALPLETNLPVDTWNLFSTNNHTSHIKNSNVGTSHYYSNKNETHTIHGGHLEHKQLHILVLSNSEIMVTA
jgi:hypothetical protein